MFTIVYRVIEIPKNIFYVRVRVLKIEIKIPIIRELKSRATTEMHKIFFIIFLEK